MQRSRRRIEGRHSHAGSIDETTKSVAHSGNGLGLRLGSAIMDTGTTIYDLDPSMKKIISGYLNEACMVPELMRLS